MSDREPSVVISVCENGPLLVRGDFELQRMADGQHIDAKRRVVALCRCGRSQIKPFCDGSHSFPLRRAVDRTNQATPDSRG
jgi:CDGSH-type Zn-finger protein